MKTRFIEWAFALILCISTSCDPLAISYSGESVEIDMNVIQISAGFIHVEFTPNEPAFYLVSIDKAVPGIDPMNYEQQFMDLALDSAYVEYCQWRHSHLLNGEEHIADFPSHSLNYGETTLYQNFLQPDTDYWLYCFVVDANTNKANGNLYVKTIHTEPESIFKNIRFAYRVEGMWDYVYPYDIETEELVTTVPWVGETVDSLDLVAGGYSSPGEYFDEKFNSMTEESSRVLTGIYAHNNNGVGDGTSNTVFEEGHTYYTAMATFDGKRNNCFDMYRFKWEGLDTHLVFRDESSTLGLY